MGAMAGNLPGFEEAYEGPVREQSRAASNEARRVLARR